MRLTRSEVEATIQCGDVVCVIYRSADGVAKLLRFFEHGRASHSIECLGGLDIVEELIGGGSRGNLYTYMRGTCDLSIKRVVGGLTAVEQKRVKSYWLTLVARGYGWDSIKRAAVTVPIRRFIRPRWPRLARTLVRLADTLLPGAMPDCSAAWVEGLRLVRQNLLSGYATQDVTPETILRDPHLYTVARWVAPVLEDD